MKKLAAEKVGWVEEEVYNTLEEQLKAQELKEKAAQLDEKIKELYGKASEPIEVSVTAKFDDVEAYEQLVKDKWSWPEEKKEKETLPIAGKPDSLLRSPAEEKLLKEAAAEQVLVPLKCFNCKRVERFGTPAEKEGFQCRECMKLTSDPKVPKGHLEKYQELAAGGLLGTELLPCDRCETSPCRCISCASCEREFDPQNHTHCPDCGYATQSTLNTIASGANS